MLSQKYDDDDDIVDSDFSIDENDEPVSDPDDEENQRRKRKPLKTKSYREPVAAAAASSAKRSKPSTSKASPTKSSASAVSNEVGDKKRSLKRPTYTVMDSAARISVRKSTAAKTTAMKQRVKVRDEEQRNRPKVAKYDDYIPTQDELLEEALITEEENLASLGTFPFSN